MKKILSMLGLGAVTVLSFLGVQTPHQPADGAITAVTETTPLYLVHGATVAPQTTGILLADDDGGHYSHSSHASHSSHDSHASHYSGSGE